MSDTTALCCDDIAVHSHDGGKTLRRRGLPCDYRTAFDWRWPAVRICHPANPRPVAILLNRYHGMSFPIGIYVQVHRRALSLLWGRPGRITWIQGSDR